VARSSAVGKETERKFLVASDAWRKGAAGTLYRQGYLSTHKERTVRVRVVGKKGYLTIKGETQGATRDEYEYPIPVNDANHMLDALCEKPLIEKTRWTVRVEPHLWEIDEFHGDNQGLVVAEIELRSEDEPFAKPGWLGQEVTGDARYFNSHLVAHPFRTW
jgi:adenylate cyclase